MLIRGIFKEALTEAILEASRIRAQERHHTTLRALGEGIEHAGVVLYLVAATGVTITAIQAVDHAMH